MLTLLEGHPNVDVMLFYAIATTALGVLLYRFHRRQV